MAGFPVMVGSPARVAGMRLAALACAAGALAPSALYAQEAELAGFGAVAAQEELRYEAALLAEIHPDTIARWARALGASSHVAGTPAQRATRDSVLAWLSRVGMEVRSDTLIAYLPQPIQVAVQRLSPDPKDLQLAEGHISEAGPPGRDPFAVFNAYSGSADVEGEVVYVSYGLPDDYRVLDSLGVQVDGKILVARYGRSFRGIKVREAERRGAVGLILYSDPADDGYRKGDVYPEGPMRPAHGVQRGSILNGSGDPSTPGWPSLPDAPRLEEAEMTGIARIPVVPLSHASAAELLEELGGAAAPKGWQGALPFHYHTGPGPVRARVSVRTEQGSEALHPIFNTIAVVRGVEFPDEWVVVGAHRDAWGPGARDNVSGTSSVLAAAQAFALAARAGLSPRRTVLFATWDAEEWGLVGSTEWVEAHAAEVRASVVAYLNQDGAAGGPNFSASATPELKSLLRSAASAVESPDGEGSVLAGWGRQTTRRVPEDSTSRQPPRVGDLGGGSDHVPFVQTAGIPGASFGFAGPGGVYHSAYDTADWMERFGDPGYARHAASASILAVMAARLANAELLPYDFVSLAADLEKRVGELASALPRTDSDAVGVEEEGAVEELRGQVIRLSEEAALLDSVSFFALAEGVAPETLQRANLHMRAAAMAFVSEGGIPGLPRIRGLLYATDPDDGYATLALPSIRLALRGEDEAELARRLEEFHVRLVAATTQMAAAREILRERVSGSGLPVLKPER